MCVWGGVNRAEHLLTGAHAAGGHRARARLETAVGGGAARTSGPSRTADGPAPPPSERLPSPAGPREGE